MVSRKKRSEPPIQVKGVILFFLVVISLCVYTFYVLAPPTPKKQPPVVPVPAKPMRLPAVTIKHYTPSCRQINERVVLFLKKQGGRGKDFRILKERSQQTQQAKWVKTEADLYLPWKVDAAQAVEELAAGLKSFPGVAVKWDREEGDRIVFTVWLNKMLSHSFTVRKRPPRLAIIIDDIGEDVKQTQAFLDLGIPLTLSILPGLTHSKDCEAIAHQRGYEVMLHLPMEPNDASAHNPGDGAVFTDMDEKQIAAIITAHLQNFRYIKGVNNHMGSRATEDEKTMTSVLKTLRAHGFYFVDSMTTPRSKAYAIAQAMDIPSGKRGIFIDNEPEVDYSKNFIHKAIKQAKQEGEAIIIGHPRETTLAALKEMTPRLKAEGISLVFVSELLL